MCVFMVEGFIAVKQEKVVILWENSKIEGHSAEGGGGGAGVQRERREQRGLKWDWSGGSCGV